MVRLLFNPRRSPRVAIRLRVQIQCAGQAWQARTEDLGPGGCLLVSPRPLEAGAFVRLIVDGGKLAESLQVAGRIAWTVPGDQLRAGVAFVADEGDQGPAAWFERLKRATPEVVQLLRHVPDRLSFERPLFLAPPPRFIVDFTRQELAVVAAMYHGISVEELLHRIGHEKRNEGRLIFALLARHVLTLSAQEAADPSAWRPVLEQAGIPWKEDLQGGEPEEMVRFQDLGADAAAAPPAEPEPVALDEIPAPPEPEPVALEEILAPERPAAPVPARTPALAQAPPTAAAPPAARPPAPRPGTRPVVRRPEAQKAFEEGLAVVERGDIAGGIKLLRQALALSPRDPEIAAAIGALAFKDRKLPEE